MSALERLREAIAELETPADPWLAPLQRVRGKIEFDGQERVSSQTLLDILDAEMCQLSGRAGEVLAIEPTLQLSCLSTGSIQLWRSGTLRGRTRALAPCTRLA